IIDALIKTKFKKDQEVKAEFSRVFYDIMEVLNRPTESKMLLAELADRLSSNIEKLYSGLKVTNKVPESVKITHPSVYSQVLQPLIQNAASEAYEYGSNAVTVRYNSGYLVIENKSKNAKALSKWLEPDGTPNLNKVQTTKSTGTKIGIRRSVSSLQSIDQTLQYEVEGNTVYTKIGVDAGTAGKPKYESKKGQKPKVLFLDYTDGDRFAGMKNLMPHLDSRFEYVWDSGLNTSPKKLSEFDFRYCFLIITHVDAEPMEVLVSPEVVRQNPNTRYGIIKADSIELFIKAAQYFASECGVKKILKDYIDFHETSLPSSEELNKLIQASYNKYQASIAK
ncbi:hypothetical protein JXA85_03705, partial [Candidatus Woesearchaeota archaeon]|nr:hypothetical protein [Candidatus Woesearchaeota archaeon]